MGVADIPLLGQIKGRLGWLDERQRVIAENVANADTPGYVCLLYTSPSPRDVEESRMPSSA